MANSFLRFSVQPSLIDLLGGKPRHLFANSLDHHKALLVLAKVNIWNSSTYPCILFEGNSIPLGGNHFPLPICVSGYSVPICLEHGDGDKVGYTLFVQPYL